MNTIINYSNCSIEELIQLRAELNNIIDQKKAQAYEMAISKVIDELEKIAKDYPYETAFDDIDGEISWKDLYKAVYDYQLKKF